jgi:NAD(P)H-dependent nitrite reductase small subunit
MDQANYMDACSLAELAPGRAKAIDANGRRIALFRTTGGGVFALDNTCPHRGGPLSEGDVIGNEIVCPWHLWGFELDTGRCPGNPEVKVATHEVQIDGDRILVKVAP